MHPVLKTVLQRLGLGILTLLAVSVIIFASLELLPGGFAEAILGQSATPETVAKFNESLGLDRPALVRYFEWVGGALTGNFGVSFAGAGSGWGATDVRYVTDVIAPRLYLLPRGHGSGDCRAHCAGAWPAVRALPQQLV
jgi:peptide/nickel transport system permease protein